MDIVHTKLAAVYSTLAQIVPEYQPPQAAINEEGPVSTPVIMIGLIACVAAVGFGFLIIRRRKRRKRHFVDR